jgi:hypothetical protein
MAAARLPWGSGVVIRRRAHNEASYHDMVLLLSHLQRPRQKGRDLVRGGIAAQGPVQAWQAACTRRNHQS